LGSWWIFGGTRAGDTPNDLWADEPPSIGRDFPTVHGLSRDSCSCFFFFCGGGQLSYDLATLKQMVQANLVMLKFQSPQPGPHCTLMISLKRLGNKRNKLSLYLVE
jgi:hypothetical protein